MALFINGGYVTNTSFSAAFDFLNTLSVSWYINNMSGTGGQFGSFDFGTNSYMLISAEL